MSRNTSSFPTGMSVPSPSPQAPGFVHDAKHSITGSLLSLSPTTAVYLAVVCAVLYSLIRTARPFYAFWRHYRVARTIGLPLKLIPFPPGLFSFFLFQILRRLGLLTPGTELHKLLTMGRPDSYELHKEMGDVFLTVSPAGLTLIVADPKVASHINGKRAEFPKPPNTGAIINIYGRNVINADGETWRLHRRVTGPVFSERIHSAVWDESIRQANAMVSCWPALTSASSPASAFRIPNIGEDTLRLGLNVITGAAYGAPLEWSGPAANPPAATPTHLSFRESLDQLTVHLMPLFLTPRWLLQLAPADSTWGRAWAAYTAFGSYMAGMLARERARVEAAEKGEGDEPEENLLTALIAAEKDQGGYGGDDEKGSWLRPMTQAEVTGNMFIMLFAGHETSANTLHYALVLLALNPHVQAEVLREVDEIHKAAEAEGRSEIVYERDFGQSKWIMAVMNETLRVYSPTGMTNKWSHSPSPISFGGSTYVIPAHTRISINGTGIHFNPKVWGDDCTVWRPERWIVEENPIRNIDSTYFEKEKAAKPNKTPSPAHLTIPRSPSPGASPTRGLGVWNEESPPPSLPPTPNIQQLSFAPSDRRQLPPPPPHGPGRAGTVTSSTTGLLKPAKGTYLPFSEGARMCSGRKFASVEFYAVLCVLLRSHRLTLDVDALEGERGWEGEAERVRKILRGRKPGAVTLQPPEVIPLRFIPRS